jgi:hypothetical protein
LFLRYINDFQENGAIPKLLLPILLWIAKKEWDKKQQASPFLFLFATSYLYILFLSLISIQNIYITTKSDIRYAMNIYPLLMILTVYVFQKISSKSRLVGMGIIAIQLFTNGLTLFFPIRFWYRDYVNEVTNSHYIVSTEAVLTYTKPFIKPGDTMFVSPDYYVEPLQFYYGDSVRFINRISPANSRILNSATSFLPDYVSKADQPPDWIVLFGNSPYAYDTRPLPENVKLTSYQEIVLPQFAFDLTRPELQLHSFYPITKFGKQEQVYIYHLLAN